MQVWSMAVPKPSKEDCLADLKRRILATELEPGADLDEVSIAERYGLSRTPLREIFQRLAGDGYVRLEAHRGAKVASMDLATMRTFFQTAPMVYANIARLAAENRNGNEIDDLAAAQKDFKAAVGEGDPGAAALANHRFHAVIGAMAHNPYLVASLDRLLIDQNATAHFHPAGREPSPLHSSPVHTRPEPAGLHQAYHPLPLPWPGAPLGIRCSCASGRKYARHL